MINKLFKKRSERLSSMVAPSINRDGSFCLIDPALLNADRLIEINKEVALLEQISEHVDMNNKDTQDGLNLFMKTFSMR